MFGRWISLIIVIAGVAGIYASDATAADWPTGLWVGTVEINTVSEVNHSGPDLSFDLELTALDNLDVVVALVPAESGGWLYNDKGVDLGDTWRSVGADEAAWTSGATAEIGYGDDNDGDGSPDENTALTYPSGNYPAVTYFRRHFTVADPGALSELAFALNMDDGAVVYLNGGEVARFNMPAGEMGFGAYSTIWPLKAVGPSAEEFYELTSTSGSWPIEQYDPQTNQKRFELAAVSTSDLVAGDNVIAVEVHQHPGELGRTGFANMTTFVTVPTETPAPLKLRLILHVDDQGAGTVRLLKQVIQMWDPANERLVLLTDDSKIPDYAGVALRDGEQVGRRISSIGYDFDGQYVQTADTFGLGSTMDFSFTLSAEHPTNPFLHRYHPDHDNLDARYQSFSQETLEVARDIGITISDPSSVPEQDRSPGLGHDVVEGTYTETFTGLHKRPITVMGDFTLRRVTDIGTLNP